MKYLSQIQFEFIKEARKWQDLSYDEQKGYLSRHPRSKRRLTTKPKQQEQEVKQVEQEVEKPKTKTFEKQPAESMSKSQLKKFLSDNTFSFKGYSNKKGGFVFRKSYFYRHGQTEDKFAENVKVKTESLGLTPTVIDSTDRWAPWPKDSYFEAVLTFEQLKKPKESKFSTDDIKQGLNNLSFSSYKTDANIVNDNRVEIGFRDLGKWHSRPYEEDDDYPEWSAESKEKYTNKFKQWVSEQPWYDPKIMNPYISTSEKAWVFFGIEKKNN